MKKDRFFARSIAQAHERGPRPIFTPEPRQNPTPEPAFCPDWLAVNADAMIDRLLDDLEWLAPVKVGLLRSLLRQRKEAA